MLSSVTNVPSGLMGCASATLRWWVAGRQEIQTCRNSFAPSCKGNEFVYVLVERVCETSPGRFLFGQAY